MAVTAPKIDGRDSDAILREARRLAPFYTPEWKADDESGGGAALLKIFARLLEGVIRRLNDAPLKHYIAFLEMIGVKLLPASPARAPLTFILSKGTKEAVTVPARSQAAAPAADGGDPIVFETERAILATPAQLLSVHSVVPEQDRVFEHLAALGAGAQTELFADGDDNLQAHELYLGHAELFNIKSAVRIDLSVETPLLLLSRRDLVSWQYCAGEKEELVGGEPVKLQDWRPFDDVSGTRGHVVLLKKNDDELKQVKVNDVKSRWIRCVVTGPLLKTASLASLTVEDLRVRSSPLSTGQEPTAAAALAATRFAPGAGAKLAVPAAQAAPAGIDPDAAFYNDLPLKVPASEEKPLYPFGPPPRKGVPGARPRPGDTFYLASQEGFSKRGAQVTLQVNAPPEGAAAADVERVLGIGPTRAGRLKAAGVRTTADLLKLSVEETARIIQDRGAARAWTRDLREAAAKNYFDRVVTAGPAAEPDPDRVTPELSWEYWNGGGWLALEDVLDGTAALTLPGVLVFTCPEDMALTKVIGQENYWIRARIAFGDYGQEEFSVQNPETDPKVVFDTSAVKPPRLTSLKVSYSVEGVTPNYVLTLNNLQYDSVPVDAEKGGLAKALRPFDALEDDHQTLYLGFDQAPLKGPISLFFALKEQEYTDESRPRVEWEYFRLPPGESEGEWARLLVTDGTKNLTESGVVEFIGPSDFAPGRLFGRTLYWIRAVDVEDEFMPLADAAASTLALSGAASGQLKGAEAKRREAGLKLALSALLRDRGRPFRLDALKPSPAADAAPQLAEMPQPPAKGETAPPPGDPCGCGAEPCSESLESLDLPFVSGTLLAGTAPAPVFTGLYLNTAWGVQSETVRDEILGSSNGIADQRYTLTKFPVVAEEVWVDELATLTESERKTLADETPDGVREVFDDAGNLTRFLIRWSPAEDLAEAGAADRVYAIDRTFGQVQFGDGVHGTVPPIGKDNVVATYRAGGGARGNVAAGLIATLRSTIPFVDKVLNPAAAGGGSDTELVEDAVARGPRSIKHRGRAVTAEDFEQLALESSQAVARVKALPTFNDRGEYETNWVTVIIVPGSADARPAPSPQLRSRVEQYLRERAHSTVAFPKQVKVSGPAYVEVTVNADIYAQSIDLAPQVEADAVAALEAFLHPLTGGYTQSGWEFGRLPCLSDFYGLLEAVEGMDHIENLRMTLSPVTPGGAKAAEARVVSEDRPLDVVVPVYTLVYSGEHKFDVKALS